MNYQDNTQQLEKISAPYNFVPLANQVVFPEWSEQVSLDKPFANGISGTIKYEMIAETDILIGSQRGLNQGGENDNNATFFTISANGKQAIPGSSIKGMIRNVFEIVTFSKFKTQNKRYSLRDFQAKEDYSEKLRNNVKQGFLSYKNGQWVLKPCNMARIHHDAIEKHFNQKKFKFHREKTVKERYNLLKINHLQTFNFVISDHHAIFDEQGQPGSLVFVGQINTVKDSDYPTSKRLGLPKTKEYVFYDNPTAQDIVLDTDDIADFMFIHDSDKDDAPWTYWKKFRHQKIPVFFIQEDGHFRLGLSRLFRLAYKNTQHDLLRFSSDSHFSSQLDFSETVFGSIGDRPQECLKGRVSFGLATLVNGEQGVSRTVVLQSPKASFYPNYLTQDVTGGKIHGRAKHNTYMSDQTRLRGWKRYPVSDLRNVDSISDPKGEQKSNDSLNSILHPLKQGAVFSGSIRFHNLKPKELGALLWSIKLNEDSRHSIGMAKPFGYGRIRFDIQDKLSFENNSGKVVSDEECIDDFQTFMSESLQQDWLQSEQIQELLAMLDPNQGNKSFLNGNLNYLPLDAHAKAKGAKKNPKLVLSSFTGKTFTPQAVKRKPVDLSKQTEDKSVIAKLQYEAGPDKLTAIYDGKSAYVQPAKSLLEQCQNEEVKAYFQNKKKRKKTANFEIEVEELGNRRVLKSIICKV